MLFLIIQVHGFVGAILNHQLYGVCGLGDGFFDFFAILRGKMAEDVGSQVVILRFSAYADTDTFKFLGAQVGDDVFDTIVATALPFLRTRM